MDEKPICFDGQIVDPATVVPTYRITEMGEPKFIAFPPVPIFHGDGVNFFIELRTFVQNIMKSLLKHGFKNLIEDSIFRNFIKLAQEVPEYGVLYPSSVINENSNGRVYKHFFITGKKVSRYSLKLWDPVGLVITPLPAELHDHLENPRKSVDLTPYKNHAYTLNNKEYKHCSGVLFSAPNGFLQFFGGALVIVHAGDSILFPAEDHCTQPAPWRNFYFNMLRGSMNGIKVQSRKLRMEDLLTAREVIFVDSKMRTFPVEWISGRALHVQEGELYQNLKSITAAISPITLIQGSGGYNPFTQIPKKL